ncbi:unnamed protein product (macronuclear) [Paramecium tetraurelia]|uniref:Uncharacterized protein n=1 Tax=Paramecium tetraurelia TaxID=5888 RepID=A0C3L2_PARTE|nr:uncharacterized protein GSPATT00034858001 [Paramecium tetraurelia]CAK65379.1 unnamed protein product [Paramecium tetraurelia]|eukprot:XP_001432776.1 hypothetical protein (macronuclear) [Paramecium tetraurelia strain d4-2]
MINKSIQSNRNMISSQISKVVLNKQQIKEHNELIKRKTSLRYPFKEEISLQKSSNHFNGRNSMDCLESISKFQTSKKIKSPNVIISNRKLFISSRNSKKNQESVSQEPVFFQQGKKKANDYGYRVVINRPNRMSTMQIEEVMTQQSPKLNTYKDPETFTDWVEKLYGKQWFC